MSSRHDEDHVLLGRSLIRHNKLLDLLIRLGRKRQTFVDSAY